MKYENGACCAHHDSNEPAPRPVNGALSNSFTAVVQNCQRPLPLPESRWLWTNPPLKFVRAGVSLNVSNRCAGSLKARPSAAAATTATTTDLPTSGAGRVFPISRSPAAYAAPVPKHVTRIRKNAERPCASATLVCSGPSTSSWRGTSHAIAISEPQAVAARAPTVPHRREVAATKTITPIAAVAKPPREDVRYSAADTAGSGQSAKARAHHPRATSARRSASG